MPSLPTALTHSKLRIYLFLSYKFSICCSLNSLLYNVLGVLQLQSQNGWLPLLWLHKMASLLPAEYSTESDSLFNTLLPLTNIKDECKLQTLAHIISLAASQQYVIEKRKRQVLHIHCCQCVLYWSQVSNCNFMEKSAPALFTLLNCSSPECAFWWLLSQLVLHQKKSRRGPKNVHMLFLPGQTRDLESGERQ